MATKKVILMAFLVFGSIAYIVFSCKKDHKSVCNFPCGEIRKKNTAPVNNNDINDYNGISNNSMNTVFNSTLY